MALKVCVSLKTLQRKCAYACCSTEASYTKWLLRRKRVNDEVGKGEIRGRREDEMERRRENERTEGVSYCSGLKLVGSQEMFVGRHCHQPESLDQATNRNFEFWT